LCCFFMCCCVLISSGDAIARALALTPPCGDVPWRLVGVNPL
jgi:hypothetical protein